MIIPLPWESIPAGSTVLAPDGQPDVLVEILPPLFVRLARSGMWGLIGHPTGLFVAAGAPAVETREDPEAAGVRLLLEAFPDTSEVIE